jgi:large subunit ribosomal protein L21
MYAIIRTGGKQYRVEPNRSIRVEKLDGDAGSRITLNDVMLIGGNKPLIGTPTVQGAVVNVEVVEQTRNDTVLVFKKIRRHNHRRKNGHRQPITVLKVLEILRPGEASVLPAQKNIAVKSEAVETAAKVAPKTVKAAATKTAAKPVAAKAAAKAPAKATTAKSAPAAETPQTQSSDKAE